MESLLQEAPQSPIGITDRARQTLEDWGKSPGEINQIIEVLTPLDYSQAIARLNDIYEVVIHDELISTFHLQNIAPSNPNYGQCGDLAKEAYERIAALDLGIDISIAFGQSPEFFERDFSNHLWVMLMKKDPVLRRSESSNPNTLVVDPSFRKVDVFSDSGYTLQGFLNADQIDLQKYNNTEPSPTMHFETQSQKLRPGIAREFVLGTTSDRAHVVSFAVLDDVNHSPVVGFHNKGHDASYVFKHPITGEIIIQGKQIESQEDLDKVKEWLNTNKLQIIKNPSMAQLLEEQSKIITRIIDSINEDED